MTDEQKLQDEETTEKDEQIEEEGKEDEEQTSYEESDESEAEGGESEESEEESEVSDSEQEEQRAYYSEQIAKLDDIIADYGAKELADMKRNKLKQAKYSDEQADRYIKFIEGNSEKEIEQSVRHLLQDIPPVKYSYVDPSANNGTARRKSEGKGQQLANYGRKLADRFKRGR